MPIHARVVHGADHLTPTRRNDAMAATRTGSVTLKGNPVTLVGPELKVGDPAPDFVLQNTALEDVTLASTAGKTRIVASVPSLDTPVCSAETKRFNDEAARLPNVVIQVVSMDLPFGAKRWCGAEGVDKVQTLSDHRTAKFGEAYGVLISGGPLDRCLTRAIFVIDPQGRIKHVEYCREITEHPNYDAALAAARG
jgi:thiol peroxidase